MKNVVLPWEKLMDQYRVDKATMFINAFCEKHPEFDKVISTFTKEWDKFNKKRSGK